MRRGHGGYRTRLLEPLPGSYGEQASLSLTSLDSIPNANQQPHGRASLLVACASVLVHHRSGGSLVGWQKRLASSLTAWSLPGLPHHPCWRGG